MIGEKVLIDELEAKDAADRFENRKPQDVLEWALSKFHPRMALSSSLQAEDMALLDMAWRINPDVRVFTLDTGRLHQETYDLIEEVRVKYGLKIEVQFPETSEVETMVGKFGVNLFYHNVELRHLCCEIRKVRPLNKALVGLDAWITGLRRDQAASRANTKKVEIDKDHGGIAKINPIADWKQDQVWRYVRDNDVPYSKLYDKGYTSIGCASCTRPIKPGEDPRAGRWWWEMDAVKECGLHVSAGGFRAELQTILSEVRERA
jgi:thioredoxin-dependent adenylylsulfate APS reductase